MTLRTLVVCCAWIAGAATAQPQSASAPPTFYRDVLPVLQQRCQGCHRPGQVAPMSLLTFPEVRPWAKAIRQAVLTRRMPPWFADPQYGAFRNEARLSGAEIATIERWVDTGSSEGRSEDAPPPLAFDDEWTIGKPDWIVQLPRELPVPASGKVEYVHVRVPLGLPDDHWVRAIEARPSHPEVVHHIDVLAFDPRTSKYGKLEPGRPYTDPFDPASLPRGDDDGTGEAYGDGAELMGGYIPGNNRSELGPGRARFLPRGSDLMLVIHFTPNGKATSERSRVAFLFSERPPTERVRRYLLENYRFAIPPNTADFVVHSLVTLRANARLLSLTPHMHLRGKSFRYEAVLPDGRRETLLVLPRYDFHWQLTYYLAEPRLLPKGTRIECTAHYDNSVNNPYNPDPDRTVRWGEQTWDEMMTGIVDIAVPAGEELAGVWEKPTYSSKQ